MKPFVVSSRQKLLTGLTVQIIPVLPATLRLSAVSGVIGIFIGLLAGLGISAALGLPLVVSLLAVLIAFGVAAIIGFGLYSAVQAVYPTILSHAGLSPVKFIDEKPAAVMQENRAAVRADSGCGDSG